MKTNNSVHRGVLSILAVMSILLSLVAAQLIVQQWKQVDHRLGEDAAVISDQIELDEFISAQSSASPAQFVGEAPIQVPTGVFVQSMVFATSANVNLTGYIWQKYPVNFPYEKGIEFPEQIASGDTRIREEYRIEVSKEDPLDGVAHTLVGYYFDVTLRQSFDYKKYPLDFLTVWLRIWPREIENDEKILLVPDFISYADTTQKTFGLDKYLVQGEWEIDTSFFSYQKVPYDTNFGFSGNERPAITNYQEFYFNIGIQRKFINAFTISLVPLFVVALLLFSSLMIITDDTEQSGRFGFSTSGLLGTCSALIFVVMLSHIQVRGMFAGSGLVYIEYFYLVMYLFIMLTALNGYLFSFKGRKRFKLLHYEDNIVAKTTFWPLLLWTMLAITWMVL